MEPYNFEHEDGLVPFDEPAAIPYRIALWREKVRIGLVLGLCVTGYGGLLAIAVSFVLGGLSIEDGAAAAGFLSPIVAAATTVVAFYFRGASSA